ncbi:MAG: hypothetical protein COU22_01570 [Candidatus Komeilibacteria bacterium CG10_big_fil_rev_8_21_14_0_10_41_13]|uniref:Rod shape-determining protein MreD n=1 Tax=Candidatus Komeilibacteria bacterium CG10_big_fil_rev_8_21_14_0_10_41_13 TaxID=1974476 RepID=A0A2M6WCL4_9BACT|nr:MAG: hypothetical protein COU22_01570 [Candidatus Komeilibacteria bacterium CG10_big_fil_rev_8_21_14_0_10_41_13]
MKKINLIVILAILFGLALYIRLTPHPANFTPLAAVSLFAGVYLPKKWALSLPISILFISDLFLGFYDWRLASVVYACFILTALMGIYLKNRKNVLTVLSAALGSALVFFLVTNFAVWALSSWYPHTFSGLMLNYTLAVPFFRNTLMGNLFFTGVLFGAYELVKVSMPSLIKKAVK